MWGKGGSVFRNMYKGHLSKPNKGRIMGGEWGWLGLRWYGGDK